MIVGDWVKRSALRHSKWHKVESVVAGDAVTRCGKRMKNELGGFEVSHVEPLTRMIGQPQNCHTCSR